MRRTRCLRSRVRSFRQRVERSSARATDHLGLIISQSYVVDVQAARDELVQRLQQAVDRFVPPVFRGWLNEASQATVKLQAISLPWSAEES